MPEGGFPLHYPAQNPAFIFASFLAVAASLASCGRGDREGRAPHVDTARFSEFTLIIVDGEIGRGVPRAEVSVTFFPESGSGALGREWFRGSTGEDGKLGLVVRRQAVEKRGLWGVGPSRYEYTWYPEILEVSCRGYEPVRTRIPVGLSIVDFEFPGRWEPETSTWTITLHPVEQASDENSNSGGQRTN